MESFIFLWGYLGDCKDDFSVSESYKRINSLKRELKDPSSWLLGKIYESSFYLETFIPEWYIYSPES